MRQLLNVCCLLLHSTGLLLTVAAQPDAATGLHTYLQAMLPPSRYKLGKHPGLLMPRGGA